MSASENQIVVYQPDETVRLGVRLAGDTVWLTQNQMTDLFQSDRTVITRHINNVFSEGELDEKSNVHFLHIPFSDKPVKVYSLNVIISVGYRVKSIRGTQFRIWATNVLREYLLRGYVVNTRLAQLEDKVDRRLAKTEADVAELKGKVDFFVICHDRFIVVDQKEIFWTGASLKDAGRLTFAAAKMGAEVIPGLLDSIRKAMPKTRDCLRCHIGTLNGRRGECVITNCDKFERLSFKRVSDVKEAA